MKVEAERTGEISPHEVQETINRAKEFLTEAGRFLRRKR